MIDWEGTGFIGKAVTVKGFFSFAAHRAGEGDAVGGRKLMKPFGELTAGVWQGDCSLGIDQNRSRMFWNYGDAVTLMCQPGTHRPS